MRCRGVAETGNVVTHVRAQRTPDWRSRHRHNSDLARSDQPLPGTRRPWWGLRGAGQPTTMTTKPRRSGARYQTRPPIPDKKITTQAGPGAPTAPPGMPGNSSAS
jgi:hypothetical protein